MIFIDSHTDLGLPLVAIIRTPGNPLQLRTRQIIRVQNHHIDKLSRNLYLQL